MRRICCLLVLLLGGCGDGSGPPVEIIVPKGFTGPIWIVLSADGQDIPLANGRYQVVVPSGGLLRVRSFSPFDNWHKQSARYADGMPLPVANLQEGVGPDEVVLRDGSTHIQALPGGGNHVVLGGKDGKDIRWIHWFVGTEKGYRDSLDARPRGFTP
jgi:hypothetical protein